MNTPFYETYRQLCEKAGKSDNAVAAEIGLSNSTVTSWKQGALPRRPTIKKVADYFGVTPDEMMGYEGIKSPTPVSESGTSSEISALIDQLTPEQQRLILAQIKGILSNRE